MWFETPKTLRDEPGIFLALQASNKVQKRLKYEKFRLNWRLKVPKYLNKSAKLAQVVIHMSVETSKTVWDDSDIFSVLLASDKVQKWLKFAKIRLNWRLKVQKRLKKPP